MGNVVEIDSNLEMINLDLYIYMYMLEILEDCIAFLNERIYISALYMRYKCTVQVKCSTSISVLYK